ncbi:alpha/beta fold hydrolase [Pseudomonas aeruginosa]|uniref:alpha/beta fold hydrolase n=1 Tax=Pseudomonas aeruginosa TaxID=287 RepID=UPI000FC40AA1|nr:alpha/beta hydrolase [Pseudomonas aeruginosa]ELN4741098.1 alpha/beta hydrolase [Escherichia coli]EKU6308834.1 alpha/beta hydrolase [Pseudomonas aeruginosa]EKX2970412.1 alpha/beta hydrolase [Pseudomonas aeruginosa]RUE97737.1 alpha/beta hydrolase [Pseudomonas aeruginosa]HDV6122926.1 alpha/beta hydrolase [Pseudomonas aeruginosa]
MFKLIAVTLLAFLAGCASPAHNLHQLASSGRGSLVVMRGGAFPIQAWVPHAASKPLRVFIEGDGYAWVTASRPSADPTPRTPTILRLAIAEQGAGYLARPCQYVSGPVCGPAVWTDGRFSPQVLDSMSKALDGLMRASGAVRVELVGYSGGAAIALLLAGSRHDVASVQTIAGNLSPRLWAQAKGHTGLAGALDPTDFAAQLSKVPQRHLVARRDAVIPREVQSRYVAMLGVEAPVEVVEFEGDHWSGIAGAWRQYGQQPLEMPVSQEKAR